MRELAYQIKGRGASVYVVNLPDNGEKVKLDDYLINNTVDEFKKLPVEKVTTKKKNTGKLSQADKILQIAEQLPLFHDQYNEAHVFINNETVQLRSKRVKQFLSHALYRLENKAANMEALNQAISVLEGKALFDADRIELFNRVARQNDALYFDLGDGGVIEITTTGWSVQTAPILFKRYSHQQKQVMPKAGGDAWAVFNYLNVPDEHRLLVMVFIISNFIANIPHPIFHPHGPQGSGKTSLFKAIKRLCDPSSVEALITPKDKTELVQVISHHHLCLFDNLSDISGWMSDIIAMACTGGGFSKRQLFTDDHDVILQVQRSIGINGINSLISKPDLLDRAILLHLDRIEPEKRMEEAELWQSFNQVKAYILGGIFDVLVKAVGIYPDVKLRCLSRMADFSRWGYAIAEALGNRVDEFLNAYQANIERQNEEVIQSNTLAQAVLSFMADKYKWDGTVKACYAELLKQVTEDKDDRAALKKNVFTFPKHENKLRRALNKIKPNLLDYGIEFEIAQYHIEKGVMISIRQVDKSCSVSTGCTGSEGIEPADHLPAEDTEHPEDDFTNISGSTSNNMPGDDVVELIE